MYYLLDAPAKSFFLQAVLWFSRPALPRQGRGRDYQSFKILRKIKEL